MDGLLASPLSPLVIYLLHVLGQEVCLKLLHVHLCCTVGSKEPHILLVLPLCIRLAQTPALHQLGVQMYTFADILGTGNEQYACLYLYAPQEARILSTFSRSQ